MQCIYNYTPDTDHVSMVYNVAFLLYLQLMVHVMLFPMLKCLYWLLLLL
jgi:hypothetical protein